MRQVTLRVSDGLLADLQREAKQRGKSVNALVTEILEVSLHPNERLEHRAWLLSRLRAAGLLARGHVATPEDGPLPTEEEFQAAREAAGRAMRASGITSEQLIRADRDGIDVDEGPA